MNFRRYNKITYISRSALTYSQSNDWVKNNYENNKWNTK